jgi:hypothetical protein
MKQIFFAAALVSGALAFSGEQTVPAVENTSAHCPSNSCHDQHGRADKVANKEAHVFVTNNSGETITAEWMVMFSPNKMSNGSEHVHSGEKQKEANERLNWMVNAEDAKTHPIYAIEVRVKEHRGGKVLAEKKFERTLGPKDLVGKNPANLYIVYDGKCKVSAYLDN